MSQAGEGFRDRLYTVDSSGYRQWVYSDVVKGGWYRLRLATAIVLMAVYLVLPWITVGGKQAVLLDFAGRQFTFFGTTFWSTDTIFLVILFGGMGIALFFFTAVLGRIWCGWACPETVFLEFVFRPIERVIEGKGGSRRRLDKSPWSVRKLWRKGLKLFLFSIVSWVLATTALAYFLGADTMLRMISGPPSDNPIPFLLTLGMMGLLLFQFGWFREQFCSVLCPYARFQSVLMDSDSLMVGYDVVRGEPRMRGKRGQPKDAERGDCIDCGLCVRVCPAGIDIRNGLQLECVACTACIDGCDSVMESIGLKPGLIRYDTENELLGKDTRIVRPRVLFYSVLLLAYIIVFVAALMLRDTSEFQLTREPLNTPYAVLPDGRISNHFRLRLVNKASEPRLFTVSAEDPEKVAVVLPIQPVPIAEDRMQTLPLFVHIPQNELSRGKKKVVLTVRDDQGFAKRQTITILGPGS